MKNSFAEICIYQVKPTKVEEFEKLIKCVSEHYKSFKGVLNVKYFKRTHRQKDFQSAKAGEPPVRLQRQGETITYMLFWELENEKIHGEVTRSGLEKFYKEFNRCLTTMPKIILGTEIA